MLIYKKFQFQCFDGNHAIPLLEEFVLDKATLLLILLSIGKSAIRFHLVVVLKFMIHAVHLKGVKLCFDNLTAVLHIQGVVVRQK